MSYKALRHRGPLSWQGLRLQQAGRTQFTNNQTATLVHELIHTCMSTRRQLYKRFSQSLMMQRMQNLHKNFSLDITGACLSLKRLPVTCMGHDVNRTQPCRPAFISLLWNSFTFSWRSSCSWLKNDKFALSAGGLNETKIYSIVIASHDIWLIFPASVYIFSLWVSGGKGE